MKWKQAEKDNWYRQQKIQRSYLNDVVTKIEKLKSDFTVTQYGALSENPQLYPLYILRSKKISSNKKTALITGGVHGYETSGVHGALQFMNEEAKNYETDFNIVCAPCLSPWSYESINRWNTKAIDPNRSFYKESPSEECRFFLNETDGLNPYVHIDLHETTDTDNTIFRPALAARDAMTIPFSPIPDGFYVVGATENPQPDFQKAIIDAVRKLTHIAPADEKGELIGDKMVQEGVINYDVKKLFLCTGSFNPQYCTTTEVYPDSSKVTPEICVKAQVIAIKAGLDFVKFKLGVNAT